MSELIHVPEVLAPPPGLMAHRGASLIGRQDLLAIVTPEGTATHRPIPHSAIIEALIETLGFRNINVVSDGYAVTDDGMRLFGVLTLDVESSGVRISIGVRNSHDKKFALALVVGYRVTVCDNLAFHGEFEPTMRRHTKNADVRDVIAMGVERCQRGFGPLLRTVDAWQQHSLSDDQARLVIYRAFIERAGIELPRHLAARTHEMYFNPPYEEFKARTLFSLSNAFTGAIGELDPLPRFQATAKLGPFLASLS